MYLINSIKKLLPTTNMTLNYQCLTPYNMEYFAPGKTSLCLYIEYVF